MHLDDICHGLLVGKTDVVKKATAQERVRQILFIVSGDNDDRTVLRNDGLVGFVNVKLHPVEFAQKIIRKLDIRFVDLIDQQYRQPVLLESFPHGPFDDVICDIVDTFVTELRITQAGNRVILV